ncbi:MAG TPA: hypothetical protein VFS76_17535 [Pyrinomonadaceae bacterium]|nr:hypothetical protein [Pyrinomonadaceae bacterium]
MNSFVARIISSVSLVLSLSLIASAQSTAAQSDRQSQSVLTNAAVVKLVKAGFKEKTVISIIGSRIPNFDLSPDRMIELKRNGVSEKIIMAMLSRQEGLDLMLDDESWNDDEFISRGVDPQTSSGNGAASGSGSAPADGGVNIFGSGTGVKGRSKSQGRDGVLENDTMTTGSATVKIIRPPTEAGGAPSSAKLEKTKSLTNESIVELVEAGFSEGTIIRRIEQSPVEFDLAADKLEALRKRRVSDKVLAAMKAAMGEDK